VRAALKASFALSKSSPSGLSDGECGLGSVLPPGSSIEKGPPSLQPSCLAFDECNENAVSSPLKVGPACRDRISCGIALKAMMQRPAVSGLDCTQPVFTKRSFLDHGPFYERALDARTDPVEVLP
jgi:hypothetical protein